VTGVLQIGIYRCTTITITKISAFPLAFLYLRQVMADVDIELGSLDTTEVEDQTVVG